VLIDGKGDTAAAVLTRIAERRHEDVIVLDCASSGPLPGLQGFSSRDAELAADVVLGVLSDLFREAWGPTYRRPWPADQTPEWLLREPEQAFVRGESAGNDRTLVPERSEGSITRGLVELRGLEPLTFALPARRSPS
jgi:hypothetical protein